MAMPQRVRQLVFTACFVAGFLVPFVPGSLAPFLPGSLASASSREIQRIVSPDRRADAVAVTTQTGFLKPRHWYEVYLVEHGASFVGVPPVFSGLQMEHAGLVWAAPRLLEILYGRARIENFRNNWRLSGKDMLIEVRLIPSSRGFSFLDQSGLKRPGEDL